MLSYHAGKIVISGDSDSSLNNFLTEIEDFARLKGYTIEYYYDSDGYMVFRVKTH